MEFTSLEIEIKPAGKIVGSGMDLVGEFSLNGCFHPEKMVCRFMKSYHGQHNVYYQGDYNPATKAINGFYGFEAGGNDGAFQLSHK